MTLVRWEPFRDLMNLQDRMSRVFSDRLGTGTGDDFYGTWAPPVDIFERGEDLVIRAEVPGVQRDDLDIRVEDSTLVLEGERRRDSEVKEDNSYRLERSYGKFTRSFRLPTSVDASRIAATYKDGVLEVTLPKLESAKPRKVKIQAA